jgi:branched-chain amino acid transport system ATP-binding protein
MGQANGAILETRGLGKTFGGVVAVDGVDLRVRRGEVRALIGPNGAGKTTLINLITGLHPSTSGTIWLDDQEITRLPPEQIARRGIVRTFQRTTIFGGCSVLDNVVIACAGARRYRPGTAMTDRLEAEAMRVLERVGLGSHASAMAANVSHGDQRLLEIAIALALRPLVLFLDEPTAGMSLAETMNMVRVIKALKGLTSIVIVEHDMEVVMETADCVTVLSSGRIIAEGEPDVIREDPQVLDVYLGR